MYDNRKITAIVPARDEAANIGIVLDQLAALSNADGSRVVDATIVCDNASSDKTAEIAAEKGAIVVYEERQTYSLACHAALNRFFASNHADEDVLVFLDADQTMNISEMVLLLAPFANRVELVIGCRTRVESGAMNVQQRWGNRLATALIRLFWGVTVTDLGPYRAITAGALKRIDMQDDSFGWTTEMQVRAIQENIRMVEVPVSALMRVGQSKISGTLKGNYRAGKSILATIFKLKWRENGKRTRPT